MEVILSMMVLVLTVPMSAESVLVIYDRWKWAKVGTMNIEER